MFGPAGLLLYFLVRIERTRSLEIAGILLYRDLNGPEADFLAMMVEMNIDVSGVISPTSPVDRWLARGLLDEPASAWTCVDSFVQKLLDRDDDFADLCAGLQKAVGLDNVIKGKCARDGGFQSTVCNAFADELCECGHCVRVASEGRQGGKP